MRRDVGVETWFSLAGVAPGVLHPKPEDAPDGVVTFRRHVHQRYLIKHDDVSGLGALAVVM
jgi:hypothetical protein